MQYINYLFTLTSIAFLSTDRPSLASRSNNLISDPKHREIINISILQIPTKTLTPPKTNIIHANYLHHRYLIQETNQIAENRNLAPKAKRPTQQLSETPNMVNRFNSNFLDIDQAVSTKIRIVYLINSSLGILFLQFRIHFLALSLETFYPHVIFGNTPKGICEVVLDLTHRGQRISSIESPQQQFSSDTAYLRLAKCSILSMTEATMWRFSKLTRSVSVVSGFPSSMKIRSFVYMPR